jgi:hypothetical protein
LITFSGYDRRPHVEPVALHILLRIRQVHRVNGLFTQNMNFESRGIVRHHMYIFLLFIYFILFYFSFLYSIHIHRTTPYIFTIG